MIVYTARLAREGSATLAEFPDAPGCQTFARGDQAIADRATEALAGWLTATLDAGDVPPAPTAAPRRGDLRVRVPPDLAVRLQLRWARAASGFTQEAVARRIGVTKQALSAIERRGAAASVRTLVRVAEALDADLDLRIVPRHR